MSKIHELIQKRPELIFVSTFLSLGALSIAAYGLNRLEADNPTDTPAVSAVNQGGCRPFYESAQRLGETEWSEHLRSNRKFFRVPLITPQTEGEQCVGRDAFTSFSMTKHGTISVEKVFCERYSLVEIHGSRQIDNIKSDVSNPVTGEGMCVDDILTSSDHWQFPSDTVFDMYFDTRY